MPYSSVYPCVSDPEMMTSNWGSVAESGLGRDSDYLDTVTSFAKAVSIEAIVLRQIPKFIRPIFAPMITRPTKRHIRRFTSLVKPEITRRQGALKHQHGSDEKALAPERNDFLQWMIRRSLGSDDYVEATPERIALRLLVVNFGAIHTSTLSITNAIFDLLASDPNLGLIEQLREETKIVLEEEKGAWNKRSLATMYKIDSVLRESSRLGSFVVTGLARRVELREGITAPNSTHCPYQSTIAVPSVGIQYDSSVYADAETFDPFRFSRQRQSEHNGGRYIKKANLAFVSTNASFHSFGHGRHACPGRFFASNELKMLLAYISLHYDFETLSERPPNTWIGNTVLPPMKSTIRIRRRKESS